MCSTPAIQEENVMSRVLSLSLMMCGAVGIAASVFAQTVKTDAHSFLEQAAEGQQIEISLGQLAAQRAVNEQVKDFGEQMVEDHKKGSQQIEQLAMKGGVQLSPGVSEERKLKVNKLSQLSGHAFDRAYIDYILEDHETIVDEFQRRVETMQDQDIKQWIASTLPALQGHRERARQVKYKLQTNP
jgi:putative membrane protein